MSSVEIVIRPYSHLTDDPYIYSTWTRYAWYSPKEPIKESKRIFFKNKSKEIKDILLTNQVNIACCSDSPYFIIGYIAVHDSKIAWMCVKKTYKDQGIEELLIKSMKGKIDERESRSDESSPKEAPRERDSSLES